MSDAAIAYHHEAAQLLAPLAATLTPFADPFGSDAIEVVRDPSQPRITGPGMVLVETARAQALDAVSALRDLWRELGDEDSHSLLLASAGWHASIAGIAHDGNEIPEAKDVLSNIFTDVRDRYESLTGDQVETSA